MKDIIENIAKIDFSGFSIKKNHLSSSIEKLLNNPNNQHYKKSIDYLSNLSSFNLTSLAGKIEFPFLIPKQDNVNILYEQILPVVPQGILKGSIATLILKYSKSRSIKKPPLASIAIQNFSDDIPQIFEDKHWNENFIYLAIDIAGQFECLEDDRNHLYNIIKKLLSDALAFNQADGFHLRVYRSVVEMINIWSEEENKKNLVLFLKNASFYRQQKAVDLYPYAQHSLCIDFAKYVIFHLKRMKKTKADKRKTKTYEGLIDLLKHRIIRQCLEFSKNEAPSVASGVLQGAKIFAQKEEMPKEIIERIDKEIMKVNRKIQKSFSEIKLPLSREYIEDLKKFKRTIENSIALP